MGKQGRYKPQPTAPEKERVILVGVSTEKDRLMGSAWTLEESLAELARLVETDGAQVVGRLTQNVPTPFAKTFIGSGKVDELLGLVERLEAQVVVFDDELTPSQQANLSKCLGKSVKVIDRTALILDIFAVHATTQAGRLQVQLAQLQYMYPRLRGMWSHFAKEQTRGGIGSRFGQGESQLEVDRRLVRKRIAKVKQNLETLDRRRAVQAKARLASGVWRVALAGYTNAGKSTLLNALTGAEVYAKDELFATLDPTTRSCELSEGRKITLTDTVGFIQKLPTTLIEAFKSTLLEVQNADLILLVADAHDKQVAAQIEAVSKVLQQINADQIPYIVVFNKIDLLIDDELADLQVRYPDAVYISAQERRGLDTLSYRISQAATQGEALITVLIPYDKTALVHMVRQQAQIIREDYQQQGFMATIRISQKLLELLEPFMLENPS